MQLAHVVLAGADFHLHFVELRHADGVGVVAAFVRIEAEKDPDGHRQLSVTHFVAEAAVEVGREDGAGGVHAKRVRIRQAAADDFAIQAHAVKRRAVAGRHDGDKQVRLMLARHFNGFRPVVVVGGACFRLAVGDGGGHEADGAEVACDVEGEHLAAERHAVVVGSDAPFLLQGAEEGGAVEAVFFEEDEALGVHGSP